MKCFAMENFESLSINEKTVQTVIQFRDRRKWSQFHNPKDLAISISLEAAELLDFKGFVLGINGIVTFKKSDLPETLLAAVPLERLVLETDAPYLAPVPYRGKRNESANLVKVAEYLSVIYGVPLSEIASRTTENALKVFTNAEKSF